jgi:S-adenosylmethionine-diacylglycerol 3-amino-3-carboxypropyl transferase
MFTQSWEDPACDLRALTPRPGERMVAITSGGDNVLEFLLSDPSELVAIDLNPLQNLLLELKIAAIRHLDHDALLELLGVRTPGDRSRHHYQRLRPELGDAARGYWDDNQQIFEQGLLMQGGFEKYHAMLRRVIRVVVGKRRINRLFAIEDPREQRQFFDRQWNGLGWRALLKIGCSRPVLGRRLDPSWFTDQTIADAGSHFAALAEHAIAELPVRPNYFLSMILRGSYLDEESVPAYLRVENHDVIRRRLDRIRMVTDDVAAALEREPSGSIDCLALSNVFEYSPPEIFDRGRAAILRVARPGARFSLRNLLAPRRLADDAAFSIDPELSTALQRADRGFIYSRFEAATLAGALG